MSTKRKVKRVIGDVLEIPLGRGQVGFALVLESPLVAFFNVSAGPTELSAADVARYPAAFRIWVMHQPITDGEWPVIGHIDVAKEFAVPPWFFNEDPISGKITVCTGNAEERIPLPGEVDNLERAAVWSACHVEDRLRDHFAGTSNKWVISMRPKKDGCT